VVVSVAYSAHHQIERLRHTTPVPGTEEARITQAAWQATNASSLQAGEAIYERKMKEASKLNSAGSSRPLRGLFDAMRRVYTTEGVTGLFRGAGSRVLFHTPSTALTMALFECCRGFWASIASSMSTD
jgi:hypothetical protein